jgi:hypothetical protein
MRDLSRDLLLAKKQSMEMSDDDERDTKRKITGMEKKESVDTHIYIYRYSSITGEEKKGLKSGKKKKKQRMCAIYFLSYNTLGFGMEVKQGERERHKTE